MGLFCPENGRFWQFQNANKSLHIFRHFFNKNVVENVAPEAFLGIFSQNFWSSLFSLLTPNSPTAPFGST